MPWAPSSTLPGVPPRTSRGLRSVLYLSSGGWSPIRAGALYLAVEADYSFPDGSRAEVTQRYSPEGTICRQCTLVFKEPPDRCTRSRRTYSRGWLIVVSAGACLSTHTYVHTYIHTCIHTHVHVHVHVCMYACVHTCIYMHACIRAYVHTCMHAYMHTCVRVHVCMYVCVHVCMYACMYAALAAAAIDVLMPSRPCVVCHDDGSSVCDGDHSLIGSCSSYIRRRISSGRLHAARHRNPCCQIYAERSPVEVCLLVLRALSAALITALLLFRAA